MSGSSTGTRLASAAEAERIRQVHQASAVDEIRNARVIALAAIAAIGLVAVGVLLGAGAAPWQLGLFVASYALSIVCFAVIAHRTARRVEEAQLRAAAAIDRLQDERVQEALAQARRLQSVGAKVAHEIKNPLAAIKGLVQLVAASEKDERARERIGVVESEIERMEIILREYLSYSRPLEDLHPAPLKLADLVADVVAVLSARAESGGVRLVASGEAPVIEADRRRLKEALINLVSNAIEATPSGGRVEVAVGPDGDGAAIAVTDTGRGIAASDLARLGQSYFTTREGGTGLGFVLAKSAVEQHGGTLEVTSRPGAGTTVTARLPRARPPRKEARTDG